MSKPQITQRVADGSQGNCRCDLAGSARREGGERPRGKSPYTVPGTTAREWAIGLGLGAIALGLGAYGIMKMGACVSGNSLTGVIVAKHFTAQPTEQRVTFGKGGVYAQTVDGEYTFEVHVKDHPYTIWVDKKTYESKHEGETFIFMRPVE